MEDACFLYSVVHLACGTGIDAFQEALSGENTSANVAARKAGRDALILQMQKMAAGLELAADGDLVKLAATGFELKSKPTRSSGPHPLRRICG